MRGMVLTEEAKNRIWRIMKVNGVSTRSEAKPNVHNQTDAAEAAA